MAAAALVTASGLESSAIRNDGTRERAKGGMKRTDSEEQCDLMVEALSRELEEIKDQLAWLTYHLDVHDPVVKREREENAETQQQAQPDRTTLSSRLSGFRSGADTPHTAKKKIEREKAAIERASRASQVEKERKRHYLSVVDRAENERKLYNEEYLRLLRLHVEQQREKVQENSKRLLKNMRIRERKQKELRLQSKPARFRSQPPKEETSFLKKLYHSTYYQVIGVELEMRKNGKLKTLTELKEFWELMLGPPITPPPPSHTTASYHKATPSHYYKPHPLAEDEEEEEEFTSWALTALPPEQIRKPKKQQSLSFLPSLLPRVHPISSILNDSCTSSGADRHQSKEWSKGYLMKIERVERERLHTRHMYQQARANEMAMRKLLPDIDSLRVDRTLKEDEDEEDEDEEKREEVYQNVQEKETSSNLQQATNTKLTKTRRTSRKSAKKTLKIARTRNSMSSPSNRVTATLHKEVKPRESAITNSEPLPLTMTSLIQSSTAVKEPKGKSAVWSNYS